MEPALSHDFVACKLGTQWVALMDTSPREVYSLGTESLMVLLSQ